jgi:eukaryotic-like serine/threonine-protein kinase
MRILIVDDSRDFVALLRLYLKRELPDAEIIDYEYPTKGRPDPGYEWSQYDLLLLDYKLSETENGLDWLELFGKQPGFPPAIVLTAEGDEYVAARSIKLGAADYINKKDISPKRLADLISAVLEDNTEYAAEREAVLQADAGIIDLLRKRSELRYGRPAGDYKLVRLIGKGAMSHVYLAERGSDHLSLVLKILDISSIADVVVLRRFIQEAELVAGINSPFVVKIYEHGITNKYGFIAMEFFSRGDLKQRIEYGVAPEAAVSYMTHIAYGLDTIHKAGIIHRDLKPANIMFRGDDSLALADFGISKRLQGGSDLTTIGKILGTPHYMSPEQGQGMELDYRSDIYSAGILFYELLTGKKAYRAESPAALIYQHIHAETPVLKDELEKYQAVLDRCMAKQRDERYQSAEELIRDLEAFEA